MSETKIEWVVQHRVFDNVWYERPIKYETESEAKTALKRWSQEYPNEDWKLIKRTTVTTEEVIQ